MFASLALALLLTLQPAALAAPRGDECVVLLNEEGQAQAQRLEGFDLLHADPDKALGPRPAGASAIVCHRASIVPGPADWRVLADWGLPLAIAVPPRVLWIDTKDGRLRASAQDGTTLSPDEERGVGRWLDQAQLKLAGR